MSSKQNTSPELAVAIKAAQAAGQVIKNNFRVDNSESFKTPDQSVTKTDLAADKKIFDIIRESFPHHAYFSEEAGMDKTPSDYVWVIDPLDGTTNFSHHINHFCVSIALVYKQRLQLGVIFNPLSDELFTAQTGEGAQLNQQPIHIYDKVKKVADAVVSFSRNSRLEEKTRYATSIFSHIAKDTRTSRVLGSAALELAYLAAGRFDAHIHNASNFYDAAAGAIIAQEAGAVVSDFSGRPWQPPVDGSQDLLVTSPTLQPQFLSLLKNL